MGFIKTLCFLLVLSASALNAGNPEITSFCKFSQYPDKTIIIKNPNYTNATVFFSNTSTLFFEVYKPGTTAEINKIIASFQSDKAVQSLILGNTTGDYQMFVLTLKTPTNKAWFSKQFKKAGLNTILINQDPVIDVEKL